MNKLTRWLGTAAVVATIAGSGLATTAASAAPSVTPVTVTAHTSITNRPDSGAHGNDWAYDGTASHPLGRTATVNLVSEVALSNCGGHTGTGHCYHWTGKITDMGGFVTIPGAEVPGNGDLNGGTPPNLDVAVLGTMHGGANYDFYSSWKTANRSLVPTSENDNDSAPTGRQTTGNWLEQFFGSGATFYGPGLTTGGWTYTTEFGSDANCPHAAFQWVDASPDWGVNASDGNILAPSAANC